jgi:hypothetical protein
MIFRMQTFGQKKLSSLWLAYALQSHASLLVSLGHDYADGCAGFQLVRHLLTLISQCNDDARVKVLERCSLSRALSSGRE